MDLLQHYAQEFLLKDCVDKEFAPSVTANRLLGRSGFGYYLNNLEDDDSDNIQDVIFMGSGLMWKYSTVFGDRRCVEICVRD